jgi:hypothetical protein
MTTIGRSGTANRANTAIPGTRNGKRAKLITPRPTLNMLTTARALSVSGWVLRDVSIPL